ASIQRSPAWADARSQPTILSATLPPRPLSARSPNKISAAAWILLHLLPPWSRPKASATDTPMSAHEMSYSALKFAVAGDIAIITLARPEKRNALSPQMIEELLSVLETVEAGAARLAIITGEGKSFCAGMDLDALRAQIAESPEQILNSVRRIAT